MDMIRDRSNSNIYKNSTILIVASTAGGLEILFNYLRGYGFEVLVTNDGESTLSIAQMGQPDIILLDVILPGIDGFETCRRLKSGETTRDIPVIFITKSSSTVDKIRGFALGAVDYITKPIQTEEVLARLKTHLTLQNLQKALTEQNAQLQAEIAEREKLIDELDAFAHTVAHDLKNPLGVVMNYAQFIKNFFSTMSEEDLQKYTNNIYQYGHKMVNIINELLLLSSVRAEDVTTEPLDMADIIEEVQYRLAYLIEENSAEIIVPDEWPEAWGYGPWVAEIWVNYLSNAIKYGGHPPQVRVGGTVAKNGWVKFWVQDNGNGLQPEEQNRLFIPFARFSQVRIEGHGLGLSIVQRIVEKLGGQVGVESSGRPGEGAIFSFYLPKDSQNHA